MRAAVPPLHNPSPVGRINHEPVPRRVGLDDGAWSGPGEDWRYVSFGIGQIAVRVDAGTSVRGSGGRVLKRLTGVGL